MSYEIKRTDAEIDEQLNIAANGINDGSQYPGMSYEDGIQQFWLWVTGETNEKPFGGMKTKCKCKSPYCRECENRRIVENGVKMIIALNNESVDLMEKAQRPN